MPLMISPILLARLPLYIRSTHHGMYVFDEAHLVALVFLQIFHPELLLLQHRQRSIKKGWSSPCDTLNSNKTLTKYHQFH